MISKIFFTAVRVVTQGEKGCVTTIPAAKETSKTYRGKKNFMGRVETLTCK